MCASGRSVSSAGAPQPSPCSATRRISRTGGGLFCGGECRPLVEDSPDRELIGQEGDHAHPLAAASADERIHLVGPGDQTRPSGGTSPTRRLGGRLPPLGLGPLRCTPDAVGVLAIEKRAVLSGIRDVVAHAGKLLRGFGEGAPTDLATRKVAALLWGVPFAALLVASFVEFSPTARTSVWTVALLWAGGACLLNAWRSGRAHTAISPARSSSPWPPWRSCMAPDSSPSVREAGRCSHSGSWSAPPS